MKRILGLNPYAKTSFADKGKFWQLGKVFLIFSWQLVSEYIIQFEPSESVKEAFCLQDDIKFDGMQDSQRAQILDQTNYELT